MIIFQIFVLVVLLIAVLSLFIGFITWLVIGDGYWESVGLTARILLAMAGTGAAVLGVIALANVWIGGAS